MASGYERSGRTGQKERTRKVLLDAARRLLASGHVPTVEEVAGAAAISRTTAYRYFASQGELLLAAHPELTPESLLTKTSPTDTAGRLDAVVAELTRLTIEQEMPLRAMLRLSLDPEAPREEMTLRVGRAIRWIEEALASSPLTADARHRLAIAIRATSGIEALVWLTDVAGLDRPAAAALQRWSARALLRAALDQPPPSPRRARAHRKASDR